MDLVKFPLLLLVLNFPRTFTREDTEVSCVLTESCILPCSFQPGTDVVIHWIQATPGNPHVHSYYHNQDQLALQDRRFRGRTSLFKHLISGRNASLRLTGVEVQDQGRYKCYTSTITGVNEDSFVNLKVDAPVNKVDLELVENRITCSSEGIYPEPELTWSTGAPPSATFKNKTEVRQTERRLYNISSSLTVSDSDTDLVYSCEVSTGRSWRRATLRQLASISGSSSEATIHCSAPNTSASSSNLVWRFNHSQTILSRTGADGPRTVSEEWRQRVKGVSESGSLTVQDWSSDQEGTYTCELSNAEETFITNTFLRTESGRGNRTHVSAVIGGLVAVILAAAAAVGLVVHHQKKKGQRENSRRESNNDGTQTETELGDRRKEATCSQNDENLNHTPLLQPNEDPGPTVQSRAEML